MLWVSLWTRASWPAAVVQACSAVLDAEKGHNWKRFFFLMKKKRGTSVERALGTGGPTLLETNSLPSLEGIVAFQPRPGTKGRTMTESRKAFL